METHYSKSNIPTDLQGSAQKAGGETKPKEIEHGADTVDDVGAGIDV
jgi:hypothetical protein